MIRLRPVCLALALLSSAVAAHAFDSLEDVACVCAEDVINQGDYVSCVAHLSRRLVAKEAITRGERSEAVANASRVDHEALAADCESGDDGVGGWGVSVESDSPFYLRDAVSGEPAVAALTLRQWNRTSEDGFQVTQNGAQFECQFALVVRDRLQRIVRRDFPTCGRTFHDRSLLAGEHVALDLELPLAGLNAETGLLDGEPLAPGVYRIELTWSRQGPQVAPAPIVEGGRPFAGVAVRILE